MSPLRRPIRAPLVVACLSLLLIYTLWRLNAQIRREDIHHEKDIHHHDDVKHQEVDKAIVVASMKHENTSWWHEELPEWHKYIYVVDDPTAELTVPRNKGRESMVYLSFIIDNFHQLPANIIFSHSQRYQWHNDDPDYDGLPLLQNFRIPYLQEKGYLNLRCVWVLGCPAEIHPLADAVNPAQTQAHAGHHYKQAFTELFPGREVPEVVGVSCCAQFAVTREKILEQPLEYYERIRDWIFGTQLEDSISGRIIEYSWHIIFGQHSVYCPKASDCYCNMLGLCDLQCNSDGDCEGRYALPPYSILPAGWPTLGWNGETRKLGVPG